MKTLFLLISAVCINVCLPADPPGRLQVKYYCSFIYHPAEHYFIFFSEIPRPEITGSWKYRIEKNHTDDYKIRQEFSADENKTIYHETHWNRSHLPVEIITRSNNTVIFRAAIFYQEKKITSLREENNGLIRTFEYFWENDLLKRRECRSGSHLVYFDRLVYSSNRILGFSCFPDGSMRKAERIDFFSDKKFRVASIGFSQAREHSLIFESGEKEFIPALPDFNLEDVSWDKITVYENFPETFFNLTISSRTGHPEKLFFHDNRLYRKIIFRAGNENRTMIEYHERMPLNTVKYYENGLVQNIVISFEDTELERFVYRYYTTGLPMFIYKYTGSRLVDAKSFSE